MNRRTCFTIGIFLAGGLLASCGCGPGRPATTRVSGRVTYQGKPVTEGRIVFQPEHGRPAMGTLDADGRYTLTTFDAGDGALLGHHRVTIDAHRVSGGLPPEAFDLPGSRPAKAPPVPCRQRSNGSCLRSIPTSPPRP